MSRNRKSAKNLLSYKETFLSVLTPTLRAEPDSGRDDVSRSQMLPRTLFTLSPLIKTRCSQLPMQK